MNVFTEEEFKRLKEFYETHSLKRGSGELEQIAKELGRTKQFISRKAKELGLTKNNRELTDKASKNISYRAKAQIEQNGHPKGMLGKHHSIKTREHLSKTSAAYMNGLSEELKQERTRHILETRFKNEKQSSDTRTKSREKASWKQGYREVGGKKVFFRSSWEYNYALYLQYQKELGKILDWFFESDVFWFDGIKRGCVSYKPDFKVIRPDGSVYFIEIKGWMDKASKTKLKRMAKYHPEVELVLIDSKKYRIFEKDWQFKLKNWEFKKK